jgi:hypothetical protein
MQENSCMGINFFTVLNCFMVGIIAVHSYCRLAKPSD